MDYREVHLQKGSVYDQDLSADPFNAYMGKIEPMILTKIVDTLFVGQIPRYLDFACGTGRITQFLAGKATESYGVDISESMIDVAREKCPQTTFIAADLTRRDIDLKPVNMVSTFRFFGNAQDGLRLAALNAINKRLAEGGYLVFNNHRNPWALENLLYRLTGGVHDLDLSHGKMGRLLKQTGFRKLRTYGIGWWIYRSALNRRDVLDSPAARFLEPLSRLPLLGAICPDAIIVAQKIRGAGA